MILVTGATGFIGSHLLYHLVKKNKNVRATYRSETKREYVKTIFSYYSKDSASLFNQIEWAKCDINDITELEETLSKISTVYHCAALVSFKNSDFNTLRKINIEGTANLINLCIYKGIKRICHVSSIATFDKQLNKTLIDENCEWNNDSNHNVYAISKHGAELEVWRGAQEGLSTVIVNPGVVIGSGFWKNKNCASHLFYKISKGFKYSTEGITGYIDIEDVCKSMIQLTENQFIKNEQFILVNENLSSKDLVNKTLNTLNNKKKSRVLKPYELKILSFIEGVLKIFTPTKKQLSKRVIKTLTNKSYYDNSKLMKTINFELKNIDLSIEEIAKNIKKDYH